MLLLKTSNQNTTIEINMAGQSTIIWIVISFLYYDSTILSISEGHCLTPTGNIIGISKEMDKTWTKSIDTMQSANCIP